MNMNVNLLDCMQEPTDEQLEALMQSVGAEARAKAALANAALMDTLNKQTDEALSRYLPSLPKSSYPLA